MSVVKTYKSSSVIDVICTVVKAAGIPSFEVWYIGTTSGNKANISGETQVKTSQAYTNATFIARINISEDARIMCKVVDLIGAYFLEINFKMKGTFRQLSFI